MKKRFLFFLFVGLWAVIVNGHNDSLPALDKLADRLQRFGERIPQEKVFVHMDNTCYYLGDTIWFAAYTRQTNTDKPSKISRVLYAELWNHGGFLAGSFSGAFGSITSAAFLSVGNHQYFGDPYYTWKDYAYAAAFGGITGGVTNGLVSVAKGNNFWTGEAVAAGRSPFVFNNNPVTTDTKSLSIDFNSSEYHPDDNFIKHYNSHGRHADINLSSQEIQTRVKDEIVKCQLHLKVGNNSLRGTINGKPMTIQVNITSDGVVRSYNLYPGHSARTNLTNPIIPFDNLKW